MHADRYMHTDAALRVIGKSCTISSIMLQDLCYLKQHEPYYQKASGTCLRGPGAAAVRVIHAGILMPAASQLATVSPARADDSVAAAGAAADMAVAAAPSGGSLINFTNALPDDPVITVLFFTAITILSVVTLGVRCRDVPCTAEMCPQAVMDRQSWTGQLDLHTDARRVVQGAAAC